MIDSSGESTDETTRSAAAALRRLVRELTHDAADLSGRRQAVISVEQARVEQALAETIQAAQRALAQISAPMPNQD
jgi:hypothetical protein